MFPTRSQDDSYLFCFTCSFKQLQVSYSNRSPLHTPVPIPISPEKDRSDTKDAADFPCKDTTPSIGSLLHNSSLSTPNAPSYGLTPGVISSSNQTLSKMYPYDNGNSVNTHKIYPYDNNCSVNTHRMPPSSVAFPAGYSLVPPPPVNPGSITPFPVTPGRNPASTSIISAASSQMNVLMRIFPEHKPQLLQSVLGELATGIKIIIYSKEF